MAQMSADHMLAKAGAVMYDVEIWKCIPEEGVVRESDLQYCGGWDDKEGMGVSVIVAYDFRSQEWGVYMGDNLMELRTMFNSREIIIGYNNERFDDPLMRANNIHIDPAKSYDLWKQIKNTQPPGETAGYKLDNMLKANGITPKGGDGAMAPKWAQRGQWGTLISYTMGDTHKQVQLLRKACNGTMKSPKTGEYMTIKLPWEVVDVKLDGIF